MGLEVSALRGYFLENCLYNNLAVRNFDAMLDIGLLFLRTVIKMKIGRCDLSRI